MSKLLRCLLAATAFLSLVPTAASALPPPCDEVCWGPSTCDKFCSVGLSTTTCRRAGLCEPLLDEPSEAQAKARLPTDATALPPQCDYYCHCETPCDAVCARSGRVTTCGNVNVCIDFCPAAPSRMTASAAQGETGPSDEASLVCSEAQRSAPSES